MLNFKLLDHEADVGFEVYGRSLEEVFENAAHALFSLIVDRETVEPEIGKRIEVEGNGELLIVFLNELLYLWDTEGFIPKELSLKINNKVTGNVVGQLFDPHRHIIKTEVKAVTYHKFSLKETGEGFVATLVVDV
ncbi:MAG TPA: archease [Deltaproteobacteria bacterium]|nr:archease [Deltaproteobacteria bacterium]